MQSIATAGQVTSRGLVRAIGSDLDIAKRFRSVIGLQEERPGGLLGLCPSCCGRRFQFRTLSWISMPIHDNLEHAGVRGLLSRRVETWGQKDHVERLPFARSTTSV